MIKSSLLVLFIIGIIGCSTQNEVITISDEEQDSTIINSELDTLQTDNDNSETAMNHFINGSINEAKGDFTSAILEFQDALSLDESAGIYFALAKNYFYLNKIPNALLNCKKAVEMDSVQLEYRDLLADIFTTASQFDSAAVVLEKTLKLDSVRVQSFYKLARIYENSKPLEAIKIYNKLTSIIGSDWNVLLRVAELYEKLGQTDKAAEALNNLLSIDPSNTSIQKLLVQLYQKAKRYDDALKVVNDVLQFTPNDPNARELKAQIYMENNDWETAAKEYTVILKNPGVSLDNKINIGALYFNRSLQDSSLLPVTENIFKTIDKDTTDWQVKMYLGAISFSRGNDSLAMGYFKEVTRLASWNPEGWIRLGGLYFDNQKYKDAEKLMGEALHTFPDNFTINLIMGLSLSQQSKNSEALPFLKKSVSLNSNDLSALSGYGFALSQVSQNEEAIIYLDKALKLAPDDVNLLGTLGLIYNNLHMNAESDSIYQKALEIDSLNALVNNNYAFALSERGIKLDEALKMVKISIAADSLNSSYLDTIGWVYFKMGKYDLARHYIEKSINKDSGNAEVLEHLGDTEFKLGNVKQAKIYWKKAFDIDNSNTKLKTKIETGVI